MKKYKVFAPLPYEFEAVKEGWSWPAFFFTYFWAAAKRMWGIAAGILVSGVVLGGVVGVLLLGGRGGTLAIVVPVGIRVVCGFYGNAWRRRNLVNRGYEFRETVTGYNPENCSTFRVRRAPTMGAWRQQGQSNRPLHSAAERQRCTTTQNALYQTRNAHPRRNFKPSPGSSTVFIRADAWRSPPFLAQPPILAQPPSGT